MSEGDFGHDQSESGIRTSDHLIDASSLLSVPCSGVPPVLPRGYSRVAPTIENRVERKTATGHEQPGAVGCLAQSHDRAPARAGVGVLLFGRSLLIFLIRPTAGGTQPLQRAVR